MGLSMIMSLRNIYVWADGSHRHDFSSGCYVEGFYGRASLGETVRSNTCIAGKRDFGFRLYKLNMRSQSNGDY
jgi:hypothetical protein